MTEREQFEKAFPVPKGMAYAEKYNAYMRSGGDLETPKAIYYNESWQAWEAARATPEPIGDPTEEMVLAGIAAANRQMPYINDAQKVLAIWNAMQARATPALPQGVEEWIESMQFQLGDESPAGWGNYIPSREARAYLSGMAIVPVDAIKLLEIAKCPQCDNGGAYYDNHGGVCQCQWCYEKDMALAAAKEKQS